MLWKIIEMDVYFRKILCLIDDIVFYYTDLTSNP